jgi:hypothetical protein
VGTLTAGGAELVVETVLDERVREPVPLRTGAFDEYCGAYCGVHDVQQRILIDVGQLGEQAEVELAADHRRQAQDA